MKRFRPGVSFGDFVVRDVAVRKSRIDDIEPRDYRRGWLVWLVVITAMVFLAVRLIDLQVLHGGRYRILADENRIKQIRIAAPRGRILDRNGVELPRDEATAHLVGYLGEVKEDEVGLLIENGKKYEAGSRIGRSGLEAQYEEKLRGVDGGRIVEVDNAGQEVRVMGKKDSVAGQDLKVTIDGKLEEVAYNAVKSKKAGVVVSDPRNGEVLALVSSPSFDPNEISTKYEVLSANKDSPLFNRAISGVYPPGSTFKMITIAAALELGKVKPDFTFDDQGIITIGQFKYTNWLFTKRGRTEGVIGFVGALTRSTDTFFYKVGELTGPENITRWATTMGLGSKTGIDLPGEAKGLVPDPGDGRWYLGNTYHLAIGQEDTLATPLQINLMTNVLASSGRKCRPHLLKCQMSNDKCQINDQMFKCSNVQISKETLEIIKKGMAGACSEGGTAFPFFEWNDQASNFKSQYPLVACKTGTAEYVAENGKIKTHGWLTAYAPADDPQISVTVVMEGGGEGSNVAAPVVRKILAKYFGVLDTYPYGSIRGEGE